MAWSPAPYRFEAIGTHWQIDFPDGLLVFKREKLEKLITDRIEIFDKDYSRFRPDSLVTKISQKAGVYTLPSDAESLFAIYEELYQLTHGLMTPLIGNTLSAAGYDATYSLQSKEITSPEKWKDILCRNGLQLEVKKPVLLDFGAAGKGYLIDIISEILKEAGVTSFCVDAGGDIAYYNSSNEKLRIGLEHPADTEKVIGVAEIINQSLCGSAGNRRQWGNFHHIINPETLTSPRHLMAVWVIAQTTIIADALTTALFFAKPETLAAHYQFEYLMINSDFSISHSNHFPAELYTT